MKITRGKVITLTQDNEGLHKMALFYLVRHGEANYEYMIENSFWRFGRDFTLSEKRKQKLRVV